MNRFLKSLWPVSRGPVPTSQMALPSRMVLRTLRYPFFFRLPGIPRESSPSTAVDVAAQAGDLGDEPRHLEDLLLGSAYSVSPTMFSSMNPVSILPATKSGLSMIRRRSGIVVRTPQMSNSRRARRIRWIAVSRSFPTEQIFDSRES